MNVKVLFMILGFWMSLAVLYMLSLIMDADRFKTGFELTFPMLATFILVYVSWSVLTVIIYIFIKKPVIETNVKAIVGIFLVFLILWQPLIAVFDHGALQVFSGNGLPNVKAMFLSFQFSYLFFNVILYVVVFILCAGFIYYQYSQKMKSESLELAKKNMAVELSMSEMKMQALQSQLSPHFLFNSLNSISALTRIAEKDLVIQSIARLGDLLRFSLSASQRTFIRLIEEIEFTNKFIALQKLRIGQRFNYSLESASSLNQYLCPPFIVQTLVENVFSHGLEDNDKEVEIIVRITNHHNQLCVQVTNSQHETKEAINNGLGIATNNLASRLNILYGDDYAISTTQNEQHYRVKIHIPIRSENE